MRQVKPKKRLGQHFLKDKNIAVKIVNSIDKNSAGKVLEIGPGTGMLTRLLIETFGCNLFLVEIDRESVEFLKNEFPEFSERIFWADFLEFDIDAHFSEPLTITGNLPYNISSQIFFRILENRNMVNQMVCMIQKEVAERIISPPGNKNYGILSVFLQAFYNISYLFTVSPKVFYPPPKVNSSVISLKRNSTGQLKCNEKLFFSIVKSAFNQRRKVMRNSLRSFLLPLALEHPLLGKRPEQLGVDDFVTLTNFIESVAK